MGEKIELELQSRTVTGKKVKALRHQGLLPAVIYGHNMEPQTLMGSSQAVTKVYHMAGKRQPVELTIDKKRRLAMIKEVDVDPVKHQLRHVAFHAIAQNEKVQTEVPVKLAGLGETEAERAGLIILTTLDTVQLEALPADLPESLEVPTDKLAEVNDHVTVADIVVPAKVTILSEPEQVIATVYEPSALQAANDAVGGETEEESEQIDEEAVENGESEETAPPEGDKESA